MTDLPAHPTAPTGVAVLRRAIGALDEQAAELHAQRDIDSLAHGLHDLAALISDLRQLHRSIEGYVADLMDAKKAEIAGLGVIEKRKGTDRRSWRWDEINRDVWPLLLSFHDGEIMPAVDAFLDMVGLTPSKGPRVRVMRDLGLDPDEYAECTPGRVTVQIHRSIDSQDDEVPAITEGAA